MLCVKIKLHLLIIFNPQLSKQKTWLNIFVVLILAAFVFRNVALETVIEDLANLYTRVNSNRLDGKHFKRPEAAKPNVAKTSRYVNEQAKSAD